MLSTDIESLLNGDVQRPAMPETFDQVRVGKTSRTEGDHVGVAVADG